MFQEVNIIKSRVWQHVSGRQASLYGAAPWTSEDDKDNWEIVERGYTWECVSHTGRVTIGACRVPAKTYEEAVEVKNKLLSKG